MPESAVFDALCREFFSAWLRFHPEAALAAGFGDYGGLPAPQSDDDHAALGSLLETLIVALEELDHAALDPSRRLDAELLFGLAAVEHRELLERDWRHRDPLRFLPLTEIHRLTLLAPASLREDLLALLGAIPAHLRLAVTQVTPMAELIPPPLVAAAIQAAEAGPAYLRELSRSRWLRSHCHGTGEIEAAAEAAARALRQYAGALRSDISPRAAGRCGCGADHLAFLLRHRHRLPVGPEDCVQLLEQLASAAEPPAGAVEISHQAASPESAGSECARQRTVLGELGLFTLPAAPLQVASGPSSPRLVAGDGEAGWLRPHGHGHGLDYVPDLTRGQGTLYLAEHAQPHTAAARAAMQLHCLSLGWGGLHTLTFAGGMAARSLPRLLAGGVSLRRGLPLALAEQVLAPAAAARAAQRAALAQAALDLDLHLGRVDLPEARRRAAVLGDADCILADLIRNPGDALATVLGWQLIAAARNTVGNAAEAVQDFHERLLKQGPVPASTALTAAVGADATQRLLSGLCGAPQTPH